MDKNKVIQYCPEHWNNLVWGLVDNGLEEFISKDDTTLLDRLVHGKNDAGIESSTLITTLAIQVFGPEGLAKYDGCPVCAFNNITPYVISRITPNYITTVN